MMADKTSRKDFLDGKDDETKERFNAVYKQTTNYYIKNFKILVYFMLLLFPPLILILYQDIRVWMTYAKLSSFTRLNMDMVRSIQNLQSLTWDTVVTGTRRMDSDGKDLIEDFGQDIVSMISQIDVTRADSFPSEFLSYFGTYFTNQQKDLCNQTSLVIDGDRDCKLA
jgi:hypothetical protein